LPYSAREPEAERWHYLQLSHDLDDVVARPVSNSNRSGHCAGFIEGRYTCARALIEGHLKPLHKVCRTLTLAADKRRKDLPLTRRNRDGLEGFDLTDRHVTTGIDQRRDVWP